MILTPEEARNVIWGDDENWGRVSGTKKIVEQGRWDTYFEEIFLHRPTNEHYCFEWSEGSTECQDSEPFEYDNEVKPVKMIQKEVTELKWVVAKEEEAEVIHQQAS